MGAIRRTARQPAVRGALGALAIGAAVSLVTRAVKPRGGRGRVLDWDEIERLATHALEEPQMRPRRRRRLTAELNTMAAELCPPLLKLVGRLPRGTQLPPVEPVGRSEWVRLNLEIVREVIEPLLEVRTARLPDNGLVDLGRAGLDRYLAATMAFLSRRVLGQFDAQILGGSPGDPLAAMGLYIVEPNLAAWETRAALPGGQLRRWVILHELTHAWQFTAHPWLREYLETQLRELMASLASRPGAGPAAWGALVRGVPRSLEALRALQACMTLIEGHGNLVMNVVGREVLPDWDRIEAARAHRARERNLLEALLWRLTGLDLKLQQYERGEAFARAVYEAHGMAQLNRAWHGPHTLPSLEELRRPDAWVARVRNDRRSRARTGRSALSLAAG